MTRRVGPKGQVVIPKPIRDRLGIAPGDEVVFILDGDTVRIGRATSLTRLAGAFAGQRLTDELEQEHRRELEAEDARIRQLGS